VRTAQDGVDADDAGVRGAHRPTTRVEDGEPHDGRFRLLRSVRVRLLLLVLLPMTGLVALGVVQAGTSIAATSDAARGVAMADAATATADVVHELERELAETVALRDRGGHSGEALVTAQRARTDAALRRYEQARAVALSSATALAGSYQLADAQLARLSAVRAAAPPAAAKPTDTWDVDYLTITSAVVEVGQALPGQLADPRLAGPARTIAELAAATHALAQQRELLRAVLTRGSYPPADQARLAALAATERERRAAFQRAADPAAQNTFDQLVRGPDVELTIKVRDAALAGDPGLLSVDADGWYVAATHTIRTMHEVQLTLADQLHALALAQRSAAQRSATLVLGASSGLALITATIAIGLASQISRRLRRLRGAALAVARTELPAAVDALDSADDPAAVHRAQRAAARHTNLALVDDVPDEINEVGRAFGAVHRQALDLAAAQAMLRIDTAAIFVALAHRNQTLVQRQLQAIDDLERHEVDPDTLAAFYSVDHLAARMRRNSENLLVLGGSDPGRRFTTAQALLDVVRAAVSEIDDYARVDTVELPPVAVASHAVGDIVHLLAELLENATAFSPPDTAVRVTARHAANGLLVAIYDDGVGLTGTQLADANQRLASRRSLTAAAAGSMGLLVVARLAARRGIAVELHSQLGSGTVAAVKIPETLLVVDTPPTSSERITLGRPGWSARAVPERGHG